MSENNKKKLFKVISKLSSSFRNIEDVKAAFKLLDVDGDGSITRQEMTSSGHKFSGEQVDALFALGDVNDDGALGRLSIILFSELIMMYYFWSAVNFLCFRS